MTRTLQEANASAWAWMTKSQKDRILQMDRDAAAAEQKRTQEEALSRQSATEDLEAERLRAEASANAQRSIAESQSSFLEAMNRQNAEASARQQEMAGRFESSLAAAMEERMQDMSAMLTQSQEAQALRQKEQEEQQSLQDQSAWNAAVESNDAMAQLARQNFDLTQGVELKSQAVKAGAFGSSRAGIAEGVARGTMEQGIARDSLQNLAGFAGKEMDRGIQTGTTYNGIGGSIFQQAMNQTAQAGLNQQKGNIVGLQQEQDFGHQVGSSILNANNRVALIQSAGEQSANTQRVVGEQQRQQAIADTEQANRISTINNSYGVQVGNSLLS
ncbi:MAG: hypothetical protein HQM00_14230 [Magnetococcales bacterium]|nr:hypothetical protein [Magnetococcales bacterium]